MNNSDVALTMEEELKAKEIFQYLNQLLKKNFFKTHILNNLKLN